MKDFESEKHKEKILDRIKKLMAVAEDSQFEAEAETAMRMAKSYMSTYGLSVVDIETKEETVIELEVGCEGRVKSWEVDLMNTVKVLCDISPLLARTERSYKLKFIGFKEDVKIAQEIFLNLHYSLVFLAKSKYSRALEKHSFLKGCTVTILQRAKEANKKEQVEKPAYGSLVVVKEQEINRWMNENIKNRGRFSVNNRIDYEAYTQGLQEGKNIDLGINKKVE